MRFGPGSLTAAVLALSLAACNDAPAPGGGGAGGGSTGGAASGSTAKPPVPVDPLPAGLILEASPGDAADVTSVKATARAGDVVIVRGRIGGGVEPFVAGLSAMTIADRKMVPCSEMKMEDGCKTPWDYCCAAADEKAKGLATIQVVGADGKTLRADLRTAGLAPLWTVVVKGKVGPRPDPKVLVIDAEGIFVEKK